MNGKSKKHHKCPTIIHGAVDIPLSMQTEIEEFLKVYTAKNDSQVKGPYCTYSMKEVRKDFFLNAGLWTAHGSVGKHTDDAGKSLNIVLATIGKHSLKIGRLIWPLEPGTLFYLDTDKIHSTITDSHDALLVFASIDCGWEPLSHDVSLVEVGQILRDNLMKCIKSSRVKIKN